MGEGSPTDASPPSGIIAELSDAGFEDARQVARGGAGVIYCAYETALGRNVAIKVLPSHIDDESRERFLREGYAMGGLSGHPNIVNILRVGVTDSGRPYIVMPYMSSDSLAVRLRREGPTAWPEALRIAVKLCGALETAHRSGTLHRDIKPANVLVSDYGEPLLSDFGIAHIEGGYETATGFFSGTIDYTAPEVMTGKPATVASDLYSLGATIYALIAGGAAHERKNDEDLVRSTCASAPHGFPICVRKESRKRSARRSSMRWQSIRRNGPRPPRSSAANCSPHRSSVDCGPIRWRSPPHPNRDAR
ncbi:hypothetical protein MSTO_44680 [Mycobacterium stomatepiae]|uniref:non-specific serine/threonine protein kinase n=1 Tax=Mycobacterium stomatepiae TaxID=470076 RepID=A0A7I7QD63_9MYCO|nr:hypothetical protein MSTO_44680 [Mycobacterium stomatepiae]